MPLKDSWSKRHEKEPRPERGSTRQKEAPKAPTKPPDEERNALREAHPELARAHTRFLDELGLSADDADILSGDVRLVAFFDEALSSHPEGAQSVANWIVNEVLRETKETPLDSLALGPKEVGTLAKLFDEGTISSRVAKDVFEQMLSTGGDPARIVEEKGLEQIGDPARIAQIVEEVIASNAAQAEQYRGGKRQLLGFFIGKVMQASRGKADPEKTRSILLEKLDVPTS